MTLGAVGPLRRPIHPAGGAGHLLSEIPVMYTMDRRLLAQSFSGVVIGNLEKR